MKTFFTKKMLARFVAPSAKAGFTLVELLLYIALSSVILIATSLCMRVVLEARVKNQAIREVDEQGIMAMEIISHAIENAETIVTPTPGSTSSTLTVSMLTSSINPTIISAPAGALQIQEGVSTAVALTNSKVTVTGLSFTNLSRTSTPGNVKVTFTISTVNTTGRNEFAFTRTFTTSASLR